MTGGSLLDGERAARFERDLAAYCAAALAAETGCTVRPYSRRRRFEVIHPGGVLIGTAEQVLAWHREARTPERREAALREWLSWRARAGA
jgi:hypothetical protein